MISSRQQKRLVEIAKREICKKGGCGTHAGISSNWLKIAESWGTKFTYEGFRYMRRVFQNQRRGWRLRIGPYCFGFFMVTINEMDCYGYITQIAKLASDFVRESNKNWSDASDEIEKRLTPPMNKVRRLIENKMGIRPNDIKHNIDNYGILGHNVVVTDWGFDGF